MKKYYESICEIAKKKNYNLTVLENKENSQFLDSMPQPELLVGFIPMVGEGIDAQVDDLAFANVDNTEIKLLKLARK